MKNGIYTLENDTDFDEMIRQGSVLIDFYADWCEPCKWLEPILDEVLKGVDFPLSIMKIDTDKHLSITQKFQIRSVPVLMFYLNGKMVWKMNGFLTASEMIKKLEDVSREKRNQ